MRTSPLGTGLASNISLEAVCSAVVFGIFVFVGIIFVLNPNPLIAAIAFGIVGGVAHEIAQSGGKVLIPTPVSGTSGGATGGGGTSGDIYLGTLAGAALGCVAGILSLHGVSLTTQTPDTMVNIVVTAASAGLALKGVADVDPGKTKA